MRSAPLVDGVESVAVDAGVASCGRSRAESARRSATFALVVHVDEFGRTAGHAGAQVEELAGRADAEPVGWSRSRGTEELAAFSVPIVVGSAPSAGAVLAFEAAGSAISSAESSNWQ